jgi:SecD/SecF fusion protein
MPLMKRAPFRVIGNVSLWETIPRSLATTFITLVPIVSLWLFGGDTLKDFAFALLVGIGAGAYSSIFIAAPLLAMFKEREPEYARRREDEAAVDVSVGGALLETPVAATAAPAPAAPAAPAPVEAPVTTSSSAARERRQQRRSGRRPHGRAR